MHTSMDKYMDMDKNTYKNTNLGMPAWCYLDKCPGVVVLCIVEPLYGGDHAGVVHLAVKHNLAMKCFQFISFNTRIVPKF